MAWRTADRGGDYSHPSQAEVFPHLLEKVIKVPLVVGRDWDTVRDLINDIQFLQIMVHSLVRI